MGEQSSKRGFLALTLAGILSKVISVFYMPFLRAIIGDEGIGIYSFNYDVFTFVYALSSIGVQTAVAKYVSELSAHGREKDALKAFNTARKYFFLIGIGLTGLMIILAGPLATISKTSGSFYGIIALSPAIAITALLSTYRGYYQGKSNMVPVAISQVIEQFLNVTVSLLFAALLIRYGSSYGAAGGTIGTGAGALVALLMLIIVFFKTRMERKAIKSDIAGTTVREKRHLRMLLMYAFPLVLSSGLQNLGALIDAILIKSRLVESGYAQSMANKLYGFLGVYKQLYYVPLVVITALVTAIIPALARSYALKDRRGIKYNIRMSLRITTIVIIPCGFGLSMLAYEVYEIFNYNPSGASLMVTGAFVTIFMAVVQTQTAILQGTSQFYSVLKSLMIGIVLKIICNYILVGIPSININGAVIGGYLCFVVPMIINNYLIRKHLRIKVPLLKLFVKPVFASLFMSAVIFVLRIPVYGLSKSIGIHGPISVIPLLVLVGAGAIAYFYAIVALRGITRKDLDTISPRIYKLIPGFIKRKIK